MAELIGLKVVQELPDPAIVVVARTDFLKQHPDLVAKFMQGDIEASNFGNDHPQESADILAKAFNIPTVGISRPLDRA